MVIPLSEDTGHDFRTLTELTQSKLRSLQETLDQSDDFEDVHRQLVELCYLLDSFRCRDTLLEKLLDDHTSTEQRERILEQLKEQRLLTSLNRMTLAALHDRSHTLVEESRVAILRAQQVLSKHTPSFKASVRAPRILCIDDHGDTCDLVKNMLERAGYSVETEGTVAGAERLIRRQPFDLYIVDNWLPDGNGVELCRRIRALSPGAPILFYSAAAYEQDQHEALEAGAQAYITKPAASDEIPKAVAQLLRERRNKATQQSTREKSGRVFQVSYDEIVLITRAELLKSHGYEVTSALGNEQARTSLDGRDRYDLFIVGHGAPTDVREELSRWLKANFPNTKILALNPTYDAQVTSADYNFGVDGPDEWLAAVASAIA